MCFVIQNPWVAHNCPHSSHHVDHFNIQYDESMISSSQLKIQKETDNHEINHNSLMQVCYKRNIILIGINYCDTIVPIHVQDDQDQDRGQVKHDYTTLSILTAMRIVKFTNKESDNRTLLCLRAQNSIWLGVILCTLLWVEQQESIRKVLGKVTVLYVITCVI